MACPPHAAAVLPRQEALALPPFRKRTRPVSAVCPENRT
jgi:hypothetical protein